MRCVHYHWEGQGLQSMIWRVVYFSFSCWGARALPKSPPFYLRWGEKGRGGVIEWEEDCGLLGLGVTGKGRLAGGRKGYQGGPPHMTE